MARSRQQVDIVLRGRDQVSGKLKAVNSSMSKLKTAVKAFAAVMAAKKITEMGTAGAKFNHQLVQINKNTDEAIGRIKEMQAASGGVFSKTDLANFLAIQKRLNVELTFSGDELRKLDAQFTTMGLDGGQALTQMTKAIARGRAGFLQTSLGIQNVTKDLDALAKSQGVASSSMLDSSVISEFMVGKIKATVAGMSAASSENMEGWEAFEASMSDAMLSVSLALSGLAPAFRGIAELLELVADAAGPIIKSVGEVLVGAFKTLFALLEPVVFLLDKMTTLVSGLLFPLQKIMTSIGDGFADISEQLTGTFRGLGDAWDHWLGRTNALSEKARKTAIEIDNEVREIINTRRVETGEVRRTFEAVQKLIELERDHSKAMVQISKIRIGIRVKQVKEALKLAKTEEERLSLTADLELLVAERAQNLHDTRIKGFDKEAEKLEKLEDERIKIAVNKRTDFVELQKLQERAAREQLKNEERFESLGGKVTLHLNERGEAVKSYLATEKRGISHKVQVLQPLERALAKNEQSRTAALEEQAKIRLEETARIKADMAPAFEELRISREASKELAEAQLSNIDGLLNKELGISREVKRQITDRREGLEISGITLDQARRQFDLQRSETGLARELLELKHQMADLPAATGDPEADKVRQLQVLTLTKQTRQAVADLVDQRGNATLTAARELHVLRLGTAEEKERARLLHQEQDVRETLRKTREQTRQDAARFPDMAPSLNAAQAALERELESRLMILGVQKEQLEKTEMRAKAEESLHESLRLWSDSASSVSQYNKQAGAVLGTTGKLIEADSQRTKAGKLSSKAYVTGLDAIGTGLASFMSSQREQAAVLSAMEAAKAVASFPNVAAMAAHGAAATMFGLIAGGVISTGSAPAGGGGQEQSSTGGGGGPSTVVFNMGQGMIMGSPVELSRSLARATDVALRGGMHGGAV